MKDKKRTRMIAILVLLILTGMGMILLPQFTGWLQTTKIHQTVDAFRAKAETASKTTPGEAADTDPATPTVYPELLAAMRAYNQEIYDNRQSALVDEASYQATVIDLSEYGIADEAVGVISIPKIDVEMALYLGCTSEHMAMGFAQLSQTSMPIGGISTNCVVAGHRGWNGAPYMRDADHLEIGDAVYLINFWETLEYRVVDIQVIAPNEIDKILIQPGRDLLTLFTCTPYGVGSHRLILIAERVQ